MRPRERTALTAACALTSVLLAGSLSAQTRPMSIVDLLEVPVLGEPQRSPDGRLLVVELAEADWEANRRIPHLWRFDVESGEARQLTFGEKGEQSPRISPDGEWIAFLAERGHDRGSDEDEEHEQLYLLPRSGGEARRLVSHATAPQNIAWAPDGAALYFLADDPKSEEEKKREEAKDDIVAFEEDYEQRHLWRVSIADGVETRITEGDFSILEFRLSRDGRTIVHHRAPTPLIDDSDESEVWIMAAQGGDARRLTDNAVREQRGELSPDGERVLFVAAADERFESYFNDNLFVVPAATGGVPRLLLPEMPYEVYDAHWSQDGAAIFFVANTGVRSQLFRLDVRGGELEQLTTGDHTLRNWRYDARQDRHLFSLDRPSEPGDVWTLGDASELRRLSRVFAHYEETFRLPRQEVVTWTGADGEEVEGLLYYPLDHVEGRRYPLVVQTHGGPASSDKFEFGRWNDYVQVLAARGWMVFKPNYRGSTGYGDDFLRDMVGHYFQQAHLDVLTGVDHLIATGLADPERMVKMGWSGGGHMTNKIITSTDRFKAASSGAGAVNWISMYAQSDVRIYRTPWFGGTPWEEGAPIDTYWEHSPLKDVSKVTTPTLILVGEKDVRVPAQQSIELYRALDANGVPARLYIAPREPHGWRELRHGLFKVNVELEWFERWALGREYEWEAAPVAEDEEEETEEPEAEATGGGPRAGAARSVSRKIATAPFSNVSYSV